MKFLHRHHPRILAFKQSLSQAKARWMHKIKTTDWVAVAKTSPGRLRTLSLAQIRNFKERKRRDQIRIVSLGIAVIALLISLVWYFGGSGFSNKGRPAIPVVAAPVTQGVFPVVVDGLGTVTSRKVATIRSQVDGQLEKVLFQEGQIVKAGDLLAVIDPRPYAAQVMQAEGKLNQDKAQLQNAKVILKRYQVLYKQDSIARQDLDSQAALVVQYEGLIETDQGALDNAKVQLSYTQIVAPFDGRLGLRLVDAGNIVHANDANGIVTITQIKPIDVLFAVPSDRLPPILDRFNAGDEMPVKAYDRDYKTVLATGILKSIDNQIDPTTGMIKLKAEFSNDDNNLFANQFVNAQLLIQNRDNSILMPANAILRGPQGSYVYVVDTENTVSVRPVKLGGVNADIAEVLEGLSVGELVVTDGFDKLRPGAKVNLAKPTGR